MPPQIIIRASDFRPIELQDLLPSDTRFKVIVFTGDLDAQTQRDKVETFAKEASAVGGFLQKYGKRGDKAPVWDAVFEIFSIMVGKKETVNYTSVPEVLRSHWSK